jgi:hypothetical protein
MAPEANGKNKSKDTVPKANGKNKSKNTAPEANDKNKPTTVNIPEDAVKTLTVEEMYDKEKYDLSTMKEGDVFKMLEYV